MAIQQTIDRQDSPRLASKRTQQSTLLRRTLQANEIFSALSGLIFLFFSRQVAAFLGVANAQTILYLGVGLLLWAAFTVWVLMRPQLERKWVMMIIEGDLLWVVGSILLLVLAGEMFTAAGKWAIIIVGDIVATFAILQWIGLRRTQTR